jgi:hypothetical protein
MLSAELGSIESTEASVGKWLIRMKLNSMSLANSRQEGVRQGLVHARGLKEDPPRPSGAGSIREMKEIAEAAEGSRRRELEVRGARPRSQPKRWAEGSRMTESSSSGGGFLTLHPGDVGPPGTSTINFAAGQVLANNGVLRLATGAGTLALTPSVSGNGTVHVVIDVTRYFE